MNAPPLRLTPRALTLHLFAVTLLSTVSLIYLVAAQAPADTPRSDARVYVQLALGLSEFGVFGRYRDGDHVPAPAMDVAPLYPWFLAHVMHTDETLRDTLRCAMSPHRVDAPPCPQHYQRVVQVQLGLLAVTLTLLWATALVWTTRPLCAWLAWLMALAAGIVPEYAAGYLTEVLVLPLGGVFTLALALVIKRRHATPAATLAGLALGLLALTRPSFWYLLLALAGVTAMLALLPRWRRDSGPLALLCLVAALVTGPWLLRNHTHFERYTLSGGDYGSRSLLQRLAYNDMTLAECAAAFVYWLPDWGDSLARALLPPATYRRLGWDGQQTFYRRGVARMRADMRGGVVQSEVGNLLRDEVFPQPLRHGRATLALAWRGIFIGKTWGFVAWLCAALALWRESRRRRYDYLLLCLPAWFLCLFQAAVSVSIPRYNLLLLPVLALAMAQQLEPVLRRRRSSHPT